MAYFHYRCGERITLINENCTAIRNAADFDHGIVVTAEPLQNDVLFEVKIDKLISSWSGSLEIGVIDINPLHLEFPACASKLLHGSWVMTSFSVTKNGSTLVHQYGTDLDSLSQEDRVGIVRTAAGELFFYVNGESQGLAADNIPANVYGIVDLYGQCIQVTITSPLLREHNNDDCLSGSSVLAIDNDNLNVTLAGDLSELSLSSSNSFDIRMDMNVSLTLPEELPAQQRADKLRFHERCGSLIKLSNGHRSAERRRPLDEFNNGVVMTHRPLGDDELFEIRIDRLVDKWSGSIEMGITSHNPNTLVFPATMTNMRSGTIMMSGCGILTNGKGTRREYGDFNLDELSEGDRVGMMRKSDGNIHYFINGLDQGIAAQRVCHTVWGVIDLYGMTIKVSIVERDTREEQNLLTRRTIREQQQQQPILAPLDQQQLYQHDKLTFHENCGKHAEVINGGGTAHRPTAADDFNNAVVLTSRPLRPGELFEVRLDRVVTKWAGSIEIGVTTHSATDLDFPFTMTNVRSGTWMMTGSGIMHNGTTVLEQYGVNLDRLEVGDRVAVARHHPSATLHFYVNGVDQGAAASHVPARLYGVIDLYGQAVEASIVQEGGGGGGGGGGGSYETGGGRRLRSPEGGVVVPSVTSAAGGWSMTWDVGEGVMTGGGGEGGGGGGFNEFRFHYIHGSNARIINNGLTAWRPRPLAEFNDGIVFSNRPLKPGELFEVTLDNIVDRWSGSVELGVTAVKPEDINLPSTATDLSKDTWMLSGSSVMENSATILSHYPCDLDTLTAGTKIGVMINTNHTLEFFRDGNSQGVACSVSPASVGALYAVVDLYGSCAQVTITQVTQTSTVNTVVVGAGAATAAAATTTTGSYESMPLPILPVLGAVMSPHAAAAGFDEKGVGGLDQVVDLHRFSEFASQHTHVSEDGRMAHGGGRVSSLVYSATSLQPDEVFEVAIVNLDPLLAGSVAIGVTTTAPPPSVGRCDESSVGVDSSGGGSMEEPAREEMPPNTCYVTDNELRHTSTPHCISRFTPHLHWLREGDRLAIYRSTDTWRVMVNGEPLSTTPTLLPLPLPTVTTTSPPQQQLLTTTAVTAATPEYYPVVLLRGSCVGVGVVSVRRRAPSGGGLGREESAWTVLPVNMAASSRLQDSLDSRLSTVGDQDQEPISMEAPIASEEITSLIDNTVIGGGGGGMTSARYELQDNHGRNVSVGRGRVVAMRVASYNQGVVMVQPPLQLHQFIQVMVEKIDTRWESSLIVGVVCCGGAAVDRLNLPITALSFKGACCIISHDWISLNGVKSQSNFGERLNSLRVGSKVGLMLRQDGVQLYVDGVAEEALPWTPPSSSTTVSQQQPSTYAVFDLYGQCQQIKILNEIEVEENDSRHRHGNGHDNSSHNNDDSHNNTLQDCEKADLDSCEKETTPASSLTNPSNNSHHSNSNSHNQQQLETPTTSNLPSSATCSSSTSPSPPCNSNHLTLPLLLTNNATTTSSSAVSSSSSNSNSNATLMTGLTMTITATAATVNTGANIIATVNTNGISNTDNTGNNSANNGGNIGNSATMYNNTGSNSNSTVGIDNSVNNVANNAGNNGGNNAVNNAVNNVGNHGNSSGNSSGVSMMPLIATIGLTEMTIATMGGTTTMSSTSTTTTGGVTMATPQLLAVTPQVRGSSLTGMTVAPSNCQYMAEVTAYKRTLLLPEEYFTREDPTCFCTNCYKFRTKDTDIVKDESLIGWVSFPIRNLWNLQVDKWNTAYYGSRLAAVRRILDRGQPLTKLQMSTCHRIGISSRDSSTNCSQVTFSPSLQQCSASASVGSSEVAPLAAAAFQLLVKPGAYSVSGGGGGGGDDCPVEWSTKETGAICLQALLLQLPKKQQTVLT